MMECQTTTDICDKYVAEYNGFHYVSVIIFLYNTDVTKRKKEKHTYYGIQTGRFILYFVRYEMKLSLSID